MYADIFVNDSNNIFTGKIKKSDLIQLVKYLEYSLKGNKIEVFSGKNLGKLIFANSGKYKRNSLY